MKPIIVEMKEMTDSKEVYESRPNPFMVYLIYVLAALLIIALVWMCFFKIDVVVKSNGMFRSEESALDVSCNVSGIVAECNITEGQYVEQGEVLFTIEAESLLMTISEQEQLLDEVKQRLEMLYAYKSYLNGQEDALELYIDNNYYEEFSERKRLLELNIQALQANTEPQKSQYETELENVAQLISQYEAQIAKLQQAEECIKSRTNQFDVTESYYESIVSSYISNYNLTALQYNTEISQYENQVEELQEQLSLEADDLVVGNLNQQIKDVQSAITVLVNERDATLSNLEVQQIATLEQQIETVNTSLSSVYSNQALLQAQLEVLEGTNTDGSEEINVLTEKQSVINEISVCESQKTEYENILKQYDLESGKASVLSTDSGYIYLNQEIVKGSYVAQGTTVCQIYPESASKYFAEIYVENSDIARIKVGQKVKFEVAAYPSSEYGYFTGSIESISKDIKVDESSGSAYYLVKVSCDQTIITNKEGETGSVMNGMACQSKVVVEEKSVLKYLLEKINLID